MLKIDNLDLTFNKGTTNEIKLFNDFAISFNDNETTALLGPNGCGKSTLLNIIANTIRPDSITIELNNQDISNDSDTKRALKIGRVYQDPTKGVANNLTILENLAFCERKGKAHRFLPLVDKKKIPHYQELLKQLNLGLEHKLNTQVRFLSGGQRQSLALLLASMTNPEVMLLDEHTAALDPKTSHVVLEMTKQMLTNSQQMAIMVSHNMADAIKYSDRIVMLSQGQIVFDDRSENVTEEQLHQIYRNMLAV